MNSYFFVTEPEDEDKRLDAYLAEVLEGYSRSYIQKLLEDTLVSVDGSVKKKNYRLSGDEKIHVLLPDPRPLGVEAEDIPLDIYYEDDDILIVNKPKGMVVHPAAGHSGGTLVNALMGHCGAALSGINGVLRPGIVHRIDKDTSGLLAVCKNDASHASVAAQLKEHSVTRRYLAVAQGTISAPGVVDAPIGRDKKDRLRMAVDPLHGKNAVTHYRPLEMLRGYTLVECRLETGRTHQIRVHLSSLGHPLLGDELYGARKNPHAADGQCLHAGVLGLIHPRTGEYMEWTAPLPPEFEAKLAKLR